MGRTSAHRVPIKIKRAGIRNVEVKLSRIKLALYNGTKKEKRTRRSEEKLGDWRYLFSALNIATRRNYAARKVRLRNVSPP